MKNIYKIANKSIPAATAIPRVPTPAERVAKIMDNRHHKGDIMPDPYIPIVVIAAELGCDPNTLAQLLGDAVQIDSAGIRCISRDTCSNVIAEHNASLEATRQQTAARWAEVIARDPVPARRARLRNLPNTADLMGAVPGEPLAAGEALAHMREVDGSRERQLDKAARTHQELSNGQIVYHRIDEKGQLT